MSTNQVSVAHVNGDGVAKNIRESDGGRSAPLAGFKGMVRLVNSAYYIFLSQFRISSSVGGMNLRVSRTRKVVCILLNSLILLYHVMVHICLEFHREYQSEDPKLLFNLAYRIATLGISLSAIQTLWHRHTFLQKYIDTFRMENQKCLRHPWWLNLILWVSIVATFMSRVAYVLIPRQDHKILFSSTLDVITCVGNSTNTSSGENVWLDLFLESNCFLRKLAVLMYLLLRVGIYVVGSFGDSLVLVLSSEIYRTTIVLDDMENRDALALMQQYGKAKEKIGLLNQASPHTLLFMTAQFVMFCALLLPGTVQVRYPATLGLSLAYVVTCTVTLVLAAEGNRKMREREKLTISSFPIKESAHIATALTNMPGQNGLNGGNFFIMSYPFLGSMMTAIFTYVLVVHQLKASSA